MENCIHFATLHGLGLKLSTRDVTARLSKRVDKVKPLLHSDRLFFVDQPQKYCASFVHHATNDELFPDCAFFCFDHGFPFRKLPDKMCTQFMSHRSRIKVERIGMQLLFPFQTITVVTNA